MRDTKLNILLIEDNPGDARLIKEMLREAGAADMEVEWETRLSSGLSRLQQGSISAVLLDLGLPDASGSRNSDQSLLAVSGNTGSSPHRARRRGRSGSVGENRRARLPCQRRGGYNAPGEVHTLRHRA